jgi:hypothetical protein
MGEGKRSYHCRACLVAAARLAHPRCRHCAAPKVNRPRGLCWACYYAPGVRQMYPPTSPYARRGSGNGPAPRPLPEPTAALPGTPEKVEVLAARAEAGELLHHPDDAKRSDLT